MRTRTVAAAGALVLLLVAVAAVSFLLREGNTPLPTGDPPAAAPDGPGQEALDAAVSRPREDSVYPDAGDPGVDALHYDLDLEWDPVTRLLDGAATITLRAATTDDRLRLDLAPSLEVTGVELDGTAADWRHRGKDLVVVADVDEDERYVLEVDYRGSPEPVEAPTTRSELGTLGWTVTDDGEVWTMQEPYGAYTWYPVNDHPSDKGVYDFEISVPSPMVGVANGTLLSRSEDDGTTTTRWRLDDPAASYLVTIGIGDFEMTEERSASGVPLTYWTPRGEDELLDRVRFTRQALTWAEQRLGEYPYDSLGVLVVDALTGLETQTMITLGANEFATAPEVIVHEVVHHWYGNLVTPADWRDLWMNEGMATYLQGVFQAEQSGGDLDALLDGWAEHEDELRRRHGPPGDYDPASFAEGNAYYGPALMWHELRERIGDDRFWTLVRDWPREHAHGNATRRQYLAWLEDETGEELSSFFDAWLLGDETPPR